MIYKKIHIFNKRDCLLIGLSENELILMRKLFEDYLQLYFSLYESLNSIKSEITGINDLDCYHNFLICRKYIQKMFFLFNLESCINQRMSFQNFRMNINDINNFVFSISQIFEWYKQKFNQHKKIKRTSNQIRNLLKAYPDYNFSAHEIKLFFKWLMYNDYLLIDNISLDRIEYHLRKVIKQMIIKEQVIKNGYLLSLNPNYPYSPRKLSQIPPPIISSKQILNSMSDKAISLSEIKLKLKIEDNDLLNWVKVKIKEFKNQKKIEEDFVEGKLVWRLVKYE
ncbi:hypothetical protein LCGC14_0525700 [marine sediment metagenome]|uniref:Uncharacterized protein n=1 Tax=marine sediment metagenome TaxID=412755 RepID=A0A0F9SFI8_9ZZZZ